MLQSLLNNKKASGLVLAGLAAFAYYRYTKMTPEERTNLSKTIMEKGKGLLSHFMPGAEKSTFGEPTNENKGYSGTGM